MIAALREGLQKWWVAVVVLAILAAAAWGWTQWRDLSEIRGVEDADAAAVDAASRTVTALIDVDAASADEALADVLDLSTEDFREQFESQAETFRNALTTSSVEASGEVVAAGLVSRDDGNATVAVAATGTVSQGQPGTSTPRYYRMTVDLVQTDGRWLVSGMAFV
ncbi:MAG: hypothetical protein KAG51_08120 [Aeromicrobium sp.]|nr:hypothetical protein [Aeromicrobium sp.]